MLKNRFWHKAIKKSLKKLTPHTNKMKEEDYFALKSLFEKAGGSWVGLAEGDVDAWQLLRKCCSTFLKKRKENKERPFENEDEKT